MTKQLINIDMYLSKVEELRRKNEEELEILRAIIAFEPSKLIEDAILEWSGKRFTKHFVNRIEKETEKLENFEIVMDISAIGHFSLFLKYTTPSGKIHTESVPTRRALDNSHCLNVEKLMNNVDIYLSNRLAQIIQKGNSEEFRGKLEKANALLGELQDVLSEVTDGGKYEYVKELNISTDVPNIVRAVVNR